MLVRYYQIVKVALGDDSRTGEKLKKNKSWGYTSRMLGRCHEIVIKNWQYTHLFFILRMVVFQFPESSPRNENPRRIYLKSNNTD